MLCDASSSALVSDAVLVFMLWSLSEPVKGAVEADESEESSGASMVVELGVAAMVADGKSCGTASVMEGDKGVMVLFSLIETTILSSFNEVMCFSLPLPGSILDSGSHILGTWMSMGAVWDDSSPSVWSSSSEEMESTLAERSGTSNVAHCGLQWIGGVVARCG